MGVHKPPHATRVVVMIDCRAFCPERLSADGTAVVLHFKHLDKLIDGDPILAAFVRGM